MKVLVLGGNGPVGSRVADHLLITGHKACVFDHSSGCFREQFQTILYAGDLA